MNTFALSVLTQCSPFLLSCLTDCFPPRPLPHLLSRLKTEADIGILSFHITRRGFVHFHIPKIRIFFVVQEIWRSVYISAHMLGYRLHANGCLIEQYKYLFCQNINHKKFLKLNYKLISKVTLLFQMFGHLAFFKKQVCFKKNYIFSLLSSIIMVLIM